MNDLRTQAYPALSMYIGGRFIGADEREGQPVINPANGKTLGKLPHATKEDLDHAIASAQTAFETWRWSNPMNRSAILRRVAGMVRERAETLVLNITRDQGKPLAEARIEVAGAADHLGGTHRIGDQIFGIAAHRAAGQHLHRFLLRARQAGVARRRHHRRQRQHAVRIAPSGACPPRFPTT